jgi:hypothetical protein
MERASLAGILPLFACEWNGALKKGVFKVAGLDWVSPSRELLEKR